MRIGRKLDFTEHHRFCVYRSFSLSPLNQRMLTLIYQPMTGASASSLYQLLYYQVAEGFSGYSALDTQRRLLLGLGLDMNEAGRGELARSASVLEALGLMTTCRLYLPGQEEVVYEYELHAPLSPAEFFRNQHLSMLLRDKVGKYGVVALQDSLFRREPDELAQHDLQRENISMPFYELFRLSAAVDAELEQALEETAPVRQTPPPAQQPGAGIEYGEILYRFPRGSANRSYVERLRGDKDALAQLNYIAYKYDLSAADLCRLLDEDNAFDNRGGLQTDELQLKAAQLYRLDRKRETDRRAGTAKLQEEAEPELAEHGVQAEHYLPVPAQLAGRCDIQQYNMLMRNEPHTRFVRRFFPGAVPDWIERQFERIDLHYRLPAPVINVLVHYVFGMKGTSRVTKTFIEAIASNMLVQQVDEFEKAVLYVRSQQEMERSKEAQGESGGTRTGSGRAAASGGTTRSGGGYRRGQNGVPRKPVLPVAGEDASTDQEISDEELEEMRKLARKLDGR
ncbi:helicase DnaB [Paenibacillus pasadenensis]|uniref:helicase DnaB n=1 Tax=Paenibacillus pasadenensis TaxID=217090 RepID=UPI00203B5BC6|nr:helicase DnaB [Paenibacillus pasadenensis]MCM3748184.1 helicase DnaB [Paenibacillus pasadenensis]